MKKILLSAMALVAAMSVNAQEICTFNADNALGLDSDNGTALSAGTVIGETASIVASVGADDTYKPQSVKAVAGDTEINGGLQGSTNPKDEDGASSNTTLKVPVSGAYLQFEAKADGFLYVIHKASSNKAYTVFEEGEAIGYTFAAIGNKDPLPEVYQFTLAGAGEFNWLKEAGITSVEFAEQEYLKATDKAAYDARWAAQEDGTTKWTNISAGGIGVIKFPVFADCKYVVNASGSKITAGGFVFSTTDNVTIKSGDITIYGGNGENPTPGGDEQTLDIDLTAASWGWGWGVNTSNDGANLVGELTGGWGAVSTGWDPAADWSAYKTLVCVIESAESSLAPGEDGPFFQILAKGNSDDEKAAYYSFSETFTSQKTFEIPLDPKYAGTVKQFWFQGKAAGDKIVISKVYLTTKEATTGIQSAKAQAQKSAIRYNLAGQKVDGNYKGIVIENGNKMMVK